MKELSELFEQIFKQVVLHNFLLDSLRQRFHILVLARSQRPQPVISPIVTEMLLNLLSKTLGQWFVIGVSG